MGDEFYQRQPLLSSETGEEILAMDDYSPRARWVNLPGGGRGKAKGTKKYVDWIVMLSKAMTMTMESS